MLQISNILLSVTAICNAGLVLFIYARNQANRINFYFALFTFFLVCWAGALIEYNLTDNPVFALYFMKASYVAATCIGLSFYFFSIVFPANESIGKRHQYAVMALPVLFIALLLLLPSFLTKEIIFYSWGKETILGLPEYIYFACIFVFCFVGGLVRLWIKYFHTQGITRLQLLAIAASVTFAGLLGMYFNLVLPSPFLEDFQYIWTGPIFTFAIAITIAYSVFKLKLFNVKAIAAELFTFSLWIFILIRTLLSNTPSDQLINGVLLIASVIIGILLIRSVDAEVNAREVIEEQKKELESVNKQQENLLHFISHEIKGYLTKSEAGFAAIVQGDYGSVSPELAGMAGSALTEVRKGVRTVMDILDASNLKRGTVSYKKNIFDLKEVVTRVVDHLRPAADEKHLTIEMNATWELPCKVEGDEEKIRDHVVRNLVDNAIKYTPKGTIKIEVVRKDGIVRFTVEDSGVGITPGDMQRLFTEGGHGKDSIKVNVHSTGYGLYIAKTIIDAEGGKIWAESAGAGSGARFVVELPAA